LLIGCGLLEGQAAGVRVQRVRLWVCAYVWAHGCFVSIVGGCLMIVGCWLLVACDPVMVASSSLAACITSRRGRLRGPSWGRTSRVCVCGCVIFACACDVMLLLFVVAWALGLFMVDYWLVDSDWLLVGCRVRSCAGCLKIVGCFRQAGPHWRP